jgi:hypothetical protein
VVAVVAGAVAVAAGADGRPLTQPRFPQSKARLHP